jgi:hypothetical protein
MFPWLWISAPQISWPLSGAVTQDLTPEAFFRGIKPGAGVPDVEQQVFEQASYGKQLGWLMDVLVEAVDPATLRAPEAQAALVSLKKLRAKVERIKSEHRQDRLDDAIALLDKIQANSPEDLELLLLRYERKRELLARAERSK